MKSPFENKTYADFDSGKTFQNPKEIILDKQIIEFVEIYKTMDEAEQVKVRETLDGHDVYTIHTFCRRATVFGLRKQNEHILFGLSALSLIQAEQYDYRDILVSIAFVNHGIEKLKLNTDKLYHKAMLLAGDGTKKLIGKQGIRTLP